MHKIGLTFTLLGLVLSASPAALALPSLSRISDVPGVSSVFIYEDHENVERTNGFIKLYYNPTRSVVARGADGKPEFAFAWIRPNSANPEAEVVATMKLEAPVAIAERFEQIRTTYSERYKVPTDRVLILPLPIVDSKVKSFALDSYIQDQALPSDMTPFDGQLPFYFQFTYQGTNWFRKQVVEKRWRFAQYEADVHFYNEIEAKTETRHFSIPMFLDVPICAVSFDACQDW
ncbi:MAG: hypothetical protein M3Q07_25365 [Pseudobdellovibrionaceae bacterium]|nr:hypothetical protein [Pseudobdellovibrionaceae bacterium]